MHRMLIAALQGLLLLGGAYTGAAAPGAAGREARLAQILDLLPSCKPWERWREQTQELPPDFDALPSIPFLPDPLRSFAGPEIKKEDWPARRQELLGLFQYYLLGTIPPSPGNVRPADIKSREEPGALIDEVRLEFGTNRAAHLRLELILPKVPGPYPVFLTADNQRAWALVAVSRGYAACVYAAADSRDDSGAWTELWPKQDWTQLTRRAWAASRCVDYLMTLPVVNTNQIALAGHSRNGNAALVAAAVDPRIRAVIASSSGAAGVCSWRLFSEVQAGEGIEAITRTYPEWLHPRLRFFVGRENKLPIDQPQLIACIAPRPCLISAAVNDGVESLWAIEHTYYSARRAYELLECPGRLYLRYRPGGHETRAEDVESYFDWLDAVFERAPFTFPDVTLFPTYGQWLQLSGETIDPQTFPLHAGNALLRETNGTRIATAARWFEKKDEVRRRILWGLGSAPPFAEASVGAYGRETIPAAALLGRTTVPAALDKRSLNFGNYIAGDLYTPANARQSGRKLPVVIWLHPMSFATGYAPPYLRGELPHLALPRLGFAVFAFDQIGNGSRIDEIRHFYFRYPHWSLLGKMVEDTLAAVEALGKVPYLDAKRIFLLGYAMGGMTALHAAALDSRIAGVVSVAGFTPMRADTAEKGTGGVARWSRWLPLQPRLAAFVTQESRIPYDYHEVLALIAPRQVLVVAPRLDTQATLADVAACVEDAAPVFELLNARSRLRFQVAEDYNHFSPEIQKVVYAQLTTMAGL